MNKKILFISRHAPYGSSSAREALDAVFAASVYDQHLSLLFMDDGIFQLLKYQNAQSIHQKSLSSMIPALSIYGVERIYVHSESFQLRQIQKNDLIIKPLQFLSNIEVTQLLAQQNQILSF